MINKIYVGDSLNFMKKIPDNYIDMIVTSPPYDNLKKYKKGSYFDFMGMSVEIYRIIKNGGVVAWNVADQTFNGSESGTSFAHALQFKNVGFKLNDTMIWNKNSIAQDAGSFRNRYGQCFEYIFILTKGFAKKFHPIKDRINKTEGSKISGKLVKRSGKIISKSNIGKQIKKNGQRFNVWDIKPDTKKNKNHPASFPVQLASDLIISWTNKNDIVYDPFMGSGTTAIASIINHRNYLGSELSCDYAKYARKRIKNYENEFF